MRQRRHMDGRPFACGQRIREPFPRQPQHGVHLPIVMAWIMVKHHQLLDARILRDPRALEPGTVAPAAVRRVLAGSELRVVEEYVSAVRRTAQAGVGLFVPMLMIGCVNEAGAAGIDPVAARPLRMVQRERRDMR